MIRTEAQAPQPNGLVAFNVNSLPAMIERAVAQLASATTSAEVLEARDFASVVYDAAKKAARLAKAKGAHDELIAKAHRAQADALEIEATAKRRLADEYDAAQERGEVATAGGDKSKLPEQNFATVADIGLTHKDIHDAREIRDAEQADPGVIRRTLDAQLSADQEPTKAAVRKAIKAVVKTPEPKDMEIAAEMPREAKQNHGPRISIPDGTTPESVCRKGMAMEAQGLASEEVAKQIGVAIGSYRTMRDIVLLADHKGLSERDSAIAARALAVLNETQRFNASWPLVDAIATKVWGSRSDSAPRAVLEEKRLELFERRFGIIMQGCATDLEIPYLTVHRAKKAMAEIRAARRSLSDLLERIKGVHE